MFQGAVARAIQARPEFELAGTAGDGRSALAAIRELRPDIALLDQSLPELDGLDVMRAITRDELPTRVVMLSADSSSALVYDAVTLGVGAFLTKAATLAEICDTIAAVARGETVLAREVQAGLARELRERSHSDRPVLSPREAEVLRLVADGRSNPEIAAKLYISASTVKTHVKAVCEKLGVSDRSAAVAEAMRRRIIE